MLCSIVSLKCGCYYHLDRDKLSWPDTVLNDFLSLSLYQYSWSVCRVGFAQNTFHNSDQGSWLENLPSFSSLTSINTTDGIFQNFTPLLSSFSWLPFSHDSCLLLLALDSWHFNLCHELLGQGHSNSLFPFAGLCHWFYFPTLWAIYESDLLLTFQDLFSARQEMLHVGQQGHRHKSCAGAQVVEHGDFP